MGSSPPSLFRCVCTSKVIMFLKRNDLDALKGYWRQMTDNGNKIFLDLRTFSHKCS